MSSMSLFFFLFKGQVQSRLRLGVFFSAPDTRIAEGIWEALRELKEIQLIELPDPDLLPAIDRYRLDAAVGFPETLQSDIGKHRTVS